MKNKPKEGKIKEEFEKKMSLYTENGGFAIHAGIDGDYDIEKLWSWFDQKLKEKEKEVREKLIKKLRKSTELIKVEDSYGNWHNTKPTIEEYANRVWRAIEDLHSQ